MQMSMMFLPENTMSQTPQSQSVVELDGKSPAFCPNPNMPHWSSHPRVYLELDDHGAAKCPYCGTQYQLKAGAAVKKH
jgi:uncharacterized Zn-finger protein